MTALELIEESKKRADKKTAVDQLEQAFVDSIGYLRTTDEQLQHQGIAKAIESLNQVVKLYGMSVVLRAGVEE